MNDSVEAPLMTAKSEPDAERIYQLNSQLINRILNLGGILD